MSGFNIEYIITATNRVSRTINQVNKQIQNSTRKIRNSININDKLINQSLSSNIGNFVDNITSRSRAADIAVGRIQDLFYDTNNTFKKLNNTSKDFYKRMSMGAFNGFINSMSIAMPLMMAFKKPMQDVLQLQRDQLSLDYLVNNKQAKFLQSQADKYSKILEFSKSDIVDTQRILAQAVPNKQDLSRMINSGDFGNMVKISGIIAEQTHGKMQDVLKQVKQAILSTGKVNLDGVLVSGTTQHQRLMSVMDGFNQKYPNFAKKFQQLSEFKISKSFDKLNDALSKLLIVGLPILTNFIKQITSIITPIVNWTSKHKELTKILFYSVGVVLTLVAAQVALYAAGTGLALVFTTVTSIMGAIPTVISAIRIAMLALNTAFLANPIGMVISLTILLVSSMYELYTHFKLVRDAMNAFSNFVQSVVMKIFNGLEYAAGMLVRGLKYLVKAFNWIHPTKGGDKLIKQLDGVSNSLEGISKAQKKVKSISIGDKIRIKKAHDIINSSSQNWKTQMYEDNPVSKAINAHKIKIHSALSMQNNNKIDTLNSLKMPTNNNINNNTVHIYQDKQKVATYSTSGGNNSTYNLGSNSMLYGDI